MSVIRWGLFALLSLQTIGGIINLMEEPASAGRTDSLVITTVSGALAALCLWWALRSSRTKRPVIDLVEAKHMEAQAILSSLGEAATVEIGSTILTANETPVYSERSEMTEISAGRSTRGAGTRIKIGGVPLYFGGSESTRVDRTTSAGTGLLLLTSQRLLFVGTRAQFSVPLTSITSVQNRVASLTVSVARRQRPVMFTTDNGFVWDHLIRETRARHP